MADKAKWSIRNHTQIHGIHYLDVPMLAHRSHNPQTDRIRREEQQQHDSSENGNERPAQKNNFQGGSDKDRGVNKYHPTEPWLFDFRCAIRRHLVLMPAGNAQLEYAQNSNGEQQSEEGDDAYVHCSSKNSALNPGPKAAASA